MEKKIVLFVTHKPKKCGVYEFGKAIFNVLSSSEKYKFIKAECESFAELKQMIIEYHPKIIIYNYHPSVLPWICSKITKGIYKNHVSGINCIQIGIIHEVTQEVADTATAYRNRYILGPSQKKLNSLFDFYIAADPTLLLKNPYVYKTGRLIPAYNKVTPLPAVTTIGSFGFATPKKGFENLVQVVQNEFDIANIRLNIPAADFGDSDGSNAKRLAESCRRLITKPNIHLDVSHQFLNDEELLDFLSGNSINVFLYEDTDGRGISSAIDNALAVQRPIAVSRCPMFRHVLNTNPSVCIDTNNLKTILDNGFSPLETLVKDWTKVNLLWNYERILDSTLLKAKKRFKQKMGIIRTFQSIWNRLVSIPDKTFTWLRNTEAATEDELLPVQTSYIPVQLNPDNAFNRILDDSARKLYQPAVQKLTELVPKTMSKKIDRANVQQAFVFDTVFRHLENYDDPKLLCVGSYEDTASMALQRMGYVVEEIDPMINYYLQEFYTKPSTVKASYNIIFSTSVIEHDPDDESFIKCVSGLLVSGGIAIITCDYKDGWKEGELKPDVDERFYTKNDLTQRLLTYLPDCELVDKPDWDCPAPDFNYLGKYQYTFASFVFRKK